MKTPEKNIPAITVIGFRRAEHIHISLSALKNNYNAQKSDLHIFIDGPRNNKTEVEQVKKTYTMCKNFLWGGNKFIHREKKNKGIQMGVRHAIDTVLSDYKSTLIVEDDIATGPYFYDFIKQGLETFENHKSVGAICGHCYPFNRKKYNPTEPYFLKHFACWGWGTWRNVWEQVCWDVDVLLQKLKTSKNKKVLDFGNTRWVSGILDALHKKYIDTWDVQTGVSFFLQNRLCLYPPETLTNNIGWRNDGFGTHTQTTMNINPPLCYTKINISKKIVVKESLFMRKAYQNLVCPLYKRCLEYIKVCVKYIKVCVKFILPQSVKNSIKNRTKKP